MVAGWVRGGSGGKVMRWCATHRSVTGFTVDPLASTGPCRPHMVGGGCHSRPGGREGDKGDSGRMVGPPNHHPNTPHTPKGAGPPGGPSQVEVSKGRSGCVVASSVPLCLQKEGPGHGTGRRAVPVARPGSMPRTRLKYSATLRPQSSQYWVRTECIGTFRARPGVGFGLCPKSNRLERAK